MRISALDCPKRYEHPIIIAYLLKIKCSQWDVKSVKKEIYRDRLRDPELEELYFQLAQTYTSAGNFFLDKPYKCIMKTPDGLRSVGDGQEIYVDLIKRRIMFDKMDMYWIPPGMKNKFTEVNQLLKFLNVQSSPQASAWYEDDWENEKLSIDNLFMVEEMFFIQINIWNRKFCKTENRNIYRQIYTGQNCSVSKTALLHFQDETETLFVIEDKEAYFDKYFLCSTEGCFYTFKSQALLDVHLKLCGKETVKIVQEELGFSGKLIKKAEKAGLIPKCGFNRNFVFYDIESVLPRSNCQTERTKVLSTHRLVSIAVNR